MVLEPFPINLDCANPVSKSFIVSARINEETDSHTCHVYKPTKNFQRKLIHSFLEGKSSLCVHS